jgi:hypothetical protein
MIDHKSVTAAKIAVEKVREVANIVIRREQGSIDLMGCHVRADAVLTAFHLASREGRLSL